VQSEVEITEKNAAVDQAGPPKPAEATAPLGERFAAAFIPDTFDDDNATVDCVIYSGAVMPRMDPCHRRCGRRPDACAQG
jgi:hypothetical protein